MAKSSRKRRRDAWGSITEVERGKRYRIRYWAKDGESGYRRKSVTVRGTRKDAERKRSELMLDHSEDAPCPTVGEVWERWALPALERRVDGGEMGAQTLRQYRSGWSRHASPRWADVPCDAVRPLDVQQWIDGMGLNEARGALKVLRPLADFAVRYGVVDTNPFRERYLMPSASTVSRRDAGVWTLPELGEVWRAVSGEWFEAAFLLSAFGGLRVGEALGVRSEDVSECHGCAVVQVSRQVTNHGSEVSERLKTKQSHRAVPVPGRAGARLLQIAATCDGWLTGDGMGGPTNRFRLGRAWDAALADDRRPFRNLRNSWQTNCRWTLGIRPYYIESAMGHSSKSVTDIYYDRPSVEQIASVFARAWSDYLEGGGVDPIS